MECDSLEAELLPPSAPRAGDFGTSAHSGLTGTAGIANFERRFTHSSGTLPFVDNHIDCGSVIFKNHSHLRHVVSSEFRKDDDENFRQGRRSTDQSISAQRFQNHASVTERLRALPCGGSFPVATSPPDLVITRTAEKDPLLSGRSVSKDKAIRQPFITSASARQPKVNTSAMALLSARIVSRMRPVI